MQPLTLSSSESQFVQRLADAVEAGNQDLFDDHIAMGRAYFENDARVVELVNEHLPLRVSIEQIPQLLMMLTGPDEYGAAVEAFIGELLQTAAANGLEVGVDLISYLEAESPALMMSAKAWDWAEEHYPAHAWRQCLPYVRRSAP